MRTEDTLREAFDLLDRAAGARGPAAPAERVTERRTRGRWIAPLAVAASVALVAGTAAAGFALSGDGSRTASPPGVTPTGTPGHSSAPATVSHGNPPTALRVMPWRNLAFTVDAPGLSPSSVLMDEHAQVVTLVGASGSYVVRVFTTGAGPAYDKSGSAPVTVAGRPGYYARLTSDTEGIQTGVAWQYAPGAWASVARLDAKITRARAIELARTVHVGAASTALTPVAFAPLAGLRTSLWLTGYGNDPNLAGQHGYSKWNALYNLTLNGVALTVSADDIPGGLSNAGDATTIRGHRAHVIYTATGRLVSIDWNGHTVNVQEDGDGATGTFRLSRQQLLAVARSVTLVDDPAATATWHDARSALPA